MPQDDDIFSFGDASPGKPLTLRAVTDIPATRQAIYDSAFEAASTLPPVSNDRHTLRVSNVKWADPGEFTKAQHKAAVLSNGTLGRRLRGTVELVNNGDQRVLDSREVTLAKIPHLTDSGTFVHSGTEYALRNQQRLRSGAFTREKENGEIESHINVLANGPAHRYNLDPSKGVFYLNIGQANIPLMPLLQAAGAQPDEMRKAWGDELYNTNFEKADASAIPKLVDRVLHGKLPEHGDPNRALREAFENMTLDPEITQHTLGAPYDKLDKHAMLAVTSKLLSVMRGHADTDDRDHLAYQKFMGPEDHFAERLTKDYGGARRNLLFKASGRGNLGFLGAGSLQKQVDSALLGSGLGQGLEEINALEILDKMTQLTRMGEGGIASSDSVPDESRMVQPSQFGFVDAVRTPESMKVGVDVYLAGNTAKGNNDQIYNQFRNVRTGQQEWKSPRDLMDSSVAFPGAMQRPGDFVPGIKGGRLTWVNKKDVSHELTSFENSFSPLGNLVPLKSMLKGQRSAMAGRMITQALPLAQPEAPLVQSAVPGTRGQQSYDDVYGQFVGAARAQKPGRVASVSGDRIKIRHDDGTTDNVEIYQNAPYNRKSFIHQTPVVQPGQTVAAGQLLARSNQTDANGAAAIGKNMKTAYTSWGGLNFEDAIVISEAAAKKLTSEHMYQHQLETGENVKLGKSAYISLFPSKYDRTILDRMDENGLVKPGQVVQYGDPLILGAEQRTDSDNKIHKRGQAAFNDVSQTWEHHDPGVVTDVVASRSGPVVVVKSLHPMQVGDKMAGRHGNKGVVASIIPDAQMPHDKDGKPFEVILNDLGMISRVNPSQWAEAKLGTIAAKTGRPIKVEDWDPNVPDRTEWVLQQMRAHGIPDREDIFDPATGRKIPGVFTGMPYLMKLHHTAESKDSGRSGGGYDAEGAPAKGGETGSKRLSLMDSNALLSSGATATLRDAHAIRGQRNDDYWLQFMQGNAPRKPGVPVVYQKFLSDLQASGIHPVRDGSQLHIMALTDKDVDALAGDRELRNAETVSFDDNLRPIAGGLFDQTLTGGHHGKNWSALKLQEPLPSPVMEEPIRRLLGLTGDQYEDVLAGRRMIDDKTGPQAVGQALAKINVPKAIEEARQQIKYGTKTARDTQIRRLGYLKSAQRLGINPADWMLSRVPVLPPQFRPVSVIQETGVPLVADSNLLYRELFAANQNLADMKSQVGEQNVGEERLAVYNAFKAVTGLGDPITRQNQEKRVKGVLAGIFGSTAKFGAVQRKLLSSLVDNVGRAVIVPNPDMDMDTAGLPENSAFDVYQRFIVRRLRRSGMPMTQALQQVKDKTPLARKTLLDEMAERPVLINRAPVLHRYGIMAFNPKLVKGSALHMSPLVVKGFSADFDGDAVQYHVPVDDTARDEAYEKLLPSRQLMAAADFKTPMHAPSMEYVSGLYHATTGKSGRTHTFRNKHDVIKAWKNGEIGIDDTVKMLESGD